MPAPTMPETVTAEAVRAVLKGITGPGIDGDLSTSRQISEISIRNGQVVFAITVDPKLAVELEPMRKAADGTGCREPAGREPCHRGADRRDALSASLAAAAGRAPVAAAPGLQCRARHPSHHCRCVR